MIIFGPSTILWNSTCLPLPSAPDNIGERVLKQKQLLFAFTRAAVDVWTP